MSLPPELDHLFSTVDDDRNPAYHAMLGATTKQVDWSYLIWDDALEALSSKNNHVRSVAAQTLCALASFSDPDRRILVDFQALLSITRDERFVTARHCLQNIWKVGMAGPAQRDMTIQGLRRRYLESATEKNGTLIRYDIQVGLADLSAATGDVELRTLAQSWIEEESDPKYRKKYLSAWKSR